MAKVAPAPSATFPAGGALNDGVRKKGPQSESEWQTLFLFLEYPIKIKQVKLSRKVN